MPGKRRKGGRVTPPGGKVSGGRASRPARRSRLPKSIGPFSRPDPNAPLGQVGKRPSSPANLLVIGLVWVGCGLFAFFGLHSSWKIVPAIVLVGIGLLFVRGSVTATARLDQRRHEE